MSSNKSRCPYLYLRQYQPAQPWQAVVIYPHGSVDPGIPPDLTASEPQLTRIYLDELPPAGSLLMEILRLIIAPPKQAEQQARELADKRGEIPKDLLELVVTAMVYKFIHKTRKEIEAMFGLSELKQTRFYQDVHQEGREEGREEGIQLGKEEGIQLGEQRGIQSGEATLTLRILRRKLGSLSPAIEKRIQSLSVEQLEDLAECLLELGSLAELQTWLETQ